MQEQERRLRTPQRQDDRQDPVETRNTEPGDVDSGVQNRGAETDAAGDGEVSLQEMLNKAEQQAREAQEAWLRAKAEADNIRKRAQADVESAHKYGLEKFAGELLPVRDSLEAALAVENSTLEALRQGVELTLKQLDSAFQKNAIKEISPVVGEKFDPHKQQAMTTVDSDKPPNTVVHVLQKGYSLNDRVLRPALVTVSKPKGQQ